jgi:hypothetical protein
VYYRDYIIVNFDHEVSPVEQGESANIFVLWKFSAKKKNNEKKKIK